LIERAKRKTDPFDVWGTGEQTRDFIHIDDIVAATFEAVKNKINTLNLCTGRATSFIQLAEMTMLQGRIPGPDQEAPRQAKRSRIQSRQPDQDARDLYAEDQPGRRNRQSSKARLRRNSAMIQR
jgi:nucleoside-diphosphate-sugar epimerase